MTVDKPTPGNLIATVSELVDAENAGTPVDLTAYTGGNISLIATELDPAPNAFVIETTAQFAGIHIEATGNAGYVDVVASGTNAILTLQAAETRLTTAKLGFYGTNPIVPPDELTAAASLEALGLATNVFNGDTNWISLPFENGWTDLGSPWDVCAYRKDSNGFVHLKGMAQATPPTTSPIAILPAGYRVTATQVFQTAADLRITAAADGGIYVSDSSIPNASLSGITWHADA